ncbi:uncharacterized protein LOC114008293 [Tupaia chinensis]|uniref:uncharacterized protein LOC114008293 n=1 Tax=Tupaia chinensis TaxID=246437 RepID=UPI000FFCB054|nr:uncharacterized protein LOC114008293 [Tupaia chinensis]
MCLKLSRPPTAAWDILTTCSDKNSSREENDFQFRPRSTVLSSGSGKGSAPGCAPRTGLPVLSRLRQGLLLRAHGRAGEAGWAPLRVRHQGPQLAPSASSPTRALHAPARPAQPAPLQSGSCRDKSVSLSFSPADSAFPSRSPAPSDKPSGFLGSAGKGLLHPEDAGGSADPAPQLDGLPARRQQPQRGAQDLPPLRDSGADTAPMWGEVCHPSVLAVPGSAIHNPVHFSTRTFGVGVGRWSDQLHFTAVETESMNLSRVSLAGGETRIQFTKAAPYPHRPAPARSNHRLGWGVISFQPVLSPFHSFTGTCEMLPTRGLSSG